MRITLALGPFYPVPAILGGAVEKVHLTLAPHYRNAGHQVTIISRSYGDLPADEVVDGIHFIRLKSRDRSAYGFVNLLADIRYSLRVARALPPSDVTVTNSLFMPMLIPHQGAGAIYVHVARFPKNQLWLYQRVDRLQAISNAVADAIRKQTPSMAGKVATIGYPVPDVFFGRPSIPRKVTTVLFVGRIAREKGVHVLVDAFRNAYLGSSEVAKGWKLKIVGPFAAAQGGDGEDYYRDLVERAKLLGAACEFIGPIFDQEQLAQEYSSAGIFVYPSLADRGEAFGLAPLEAMAAGCATVVSGLRCFDDFVVSGRNALSFDHRAENATERLAEILADLLTNADRVAELGKQGSITACEFSAETVAQRYLEDFEIAAASRRRLLQ